jgi:hypothetical protein
MPKPVNNHIATVGNMMNVDGFRYGKDKLGKGISVMYGLTQDRKTQEIVAKIVQLIFDKTKFTAQQAKQYAQNWALKNKSRVSKFEPAEIVEDGSPTVTTTAPTSTATGQFQKKVGPMVSRQGDRPSGKLKLKEILNATNLD